MIMNWCSYHLEWCWKLMTRGGGDLHKSMMDIEDITYIRHSFHLQYKNKYNESKNQEPIQHSLLWYTFKFIQTCTLFYKSRYTHHTSFLCL
jgi:hypothetical protein